MKTTEKIELKVGPRETGKHMSRFARRSSKVPAVLYGPKNAPVNLMMEEIAVTKYAGRKYEATIFALKSDDSKLNSLNVLLKDVQTHPVTRRPTHVDLYAVDMTATIRVHIGVRFEGKPVGLADGGMLQMTLREIEVECLPADIPSEIVADVSNLGVGDTLHVSDLSVPGNVKIVSNPVLAVATVSILAEEVAAPVAVAAPVEGAAGAAGGASPAAGAAGGAAPAAGAAAGGDKKAAAPAGDKKK